MSLPMNCLFGVLQIFNLYDLLATFKQEEDCVALLKLLSWSDGDYCPFCHSDKIYFFRDDVNYKCAKCKKRFTIKTQTIFEGSKIELQKWFLASYLLVTHGRRLSSVQLSKYLGITQKSAWKMLQKLGQGLKDSQPMGANESICLLKNLIRSSVDKRIDYVDLDHDQELEHTVLSSPGFSDREIALFFKIQSSIQRNNYQCKICKNQKAVSEVEG